MPATHCSKKKPKLTTMREHNIQNQIRLWCGEHDILCFRCNVGKVQCIDGTWFDTGLPEGFSDLILLTNGTIYFCEVKAKYGQQREAQKQFQKTVEERGYKYIIARSIIDIQEALGYNNTGGN